MLNQQLPEEHYYLGNGQEIPNPRTGKMPINKQEELEETKLVHKILQECIADEVIYETKIAELRLVKGLNKAEKLLSKSILEAKKVGIEEERKRIRQFITKNAITARIINPDNDVVNAVDLIKYLKE